MTSTQVKDCFKSFWKWRLCEFPEFATFVGDHSYDDKLQSYSLESIENRKVSYVKFIF